MRRASIAGPLVLIGVGLLFLMRNILPTVQVFDLIGQYWPFLLIGWGLLRLVEIVFWAATDKPLPRSGVSGGEWVLVVFLFLVGSGMYAARHYQGWLPDGRALRGMVVDLGESRDFPIEPIEKACGKTPKLVLENFRGNARINGGDDAKVRVSGRKTIRSFEQNEADHANTQTPVELVQTGEQILVRSNQDRVNDRMRVSNDLDISVPKGTSVECHGIYGDFDITNIDGGVEIVSDNAGVRLQGIGGNVKVELRKSDIIRAVGVKGNVDLRGRGDDVELQDIAGQVNVEGTYTGALQFRNLAKPLRYQGAQVEFSAEKVPGQVRVSSGDLTGNNVTGPIRLTGRSRDVQLSDFTQSLDLTLDRGDVELRPAMLNFPKVDVRLRSGDLDLALPEKAKFNLKAQTDRGEFHNEFGPPLDAKESGQGGAVSGSTGAGPQLQLSTDRGTVTVRKAGSGDGEKVVKELKSVEE